MVQRPRSQDDDTSYAPLSPRTLEHALDHIEALPDAAVDATLAELRQRLSKPLPLVESDPSGVMQKLVNDVRGGLTRNTGGCDSRRDGRSAACPTIAATPSSPIATPWRPGPSGPVDQL